LIGAANWHNSLLDVIEAEKKKKFRKRGINELKKSSCFIG
jgi:hypothetical protein